MPFRCMERCHKSAISITNLTPSHPHPLTHSHPHSQAKRLGALNKFKTKSRSILVATDVASRGLDIPHVDVVVNFDIPTHSKVSVVSSGQFWHLTPPPPPPPPPIGLHT